MAKTCWARRALSRCPDKPFPHQMDAASAFLLPLSACEAQVSSKLQTSMLLDRPGSQVSATECVQNWVRHRVLTREGLQKLGGRCLGAGVQQAHGREGGLCLAWHSCHEPCE